MATTSTLSRFINCSKKQLNLDTVLLNGQSFRWKKYNSFLIGIAVNRIWKCWREDETKIGYQVLGRFSNSNFDDEKVLMDYFQLNVDLGKLYENWQTVDSHFDSVIKSTFSEGRFEGIRILKQPLLETILSFICSANNNISRISRIRILKQPLLETILSFICSANNNISRISNMVNNLAILYGEKMDLEVDVGEGPVQMSFFNFPTMEQLIDGLDTMETKLKEKGFGYRAKYIAKTVEKLKNEKDGFDGFQKRIEMMDYLEANKEIQKLDGIGPKVADCVCLMALGHHHVVPVDTHVFQITATHYLPQLKNNKSVTDAVYKQIGSFYSEKFGSHAGWAHSVLFSTRLKRFKENPKKPVKKKKKT
uniref:DNA-(apurinic or apyrimidinic site) lyase n=1 Tax=Panagrolaimus sp. JU765 TaxID=591449 RepID=A0AC34QJ17_9BILA